MNKSINWATQRPEERNVRHYHTNRTPVNFSSRQSAQLVPSNCLLDVTAAVAVVKDECFTRAQFPLNRWKQNELPRSFRNNLGCVCYMWMIINSRWLRMANCLKCSDGVAVQRSPSWITSRKKLIVRRSQPAKLYFGTFEEKWKILKMSR